MALSQTSIHLQEIDEAYESTSWNHDQRHKQMQRTIERGPNDYSHALLGPKWGMEINKREVELHQLYVETVKEIVKP